MYNHCAIKNILSYFKWPKIKLITKILNTKQLIHRFMNSEFKVSRNTYL